VGAALAAASMRRCGRSFLGLAIVNKPCSMLAVVPVVAPAPAGRASCWHSLEQLSLHVSLARLDCRQRRGALHGPGGPHHGQIFQPCGLVVFVSNTAM